MKTADLNDKHAADPTLVHLPFHAFGPERFFPARAQTVKCHEDRSLIRADRDGVLHSQKSLL